MQTPRYQTPGALGPPKSSTWSSPNLNALSDHNNEAVRTSRGEISVKMYWNVPDVFFGGLLATP